MGEEKLQETEDGYYVQNGDVMEWKWKPGHEPGGTPEVEPEVEPEVTEDEDDLEDFTKEELQDLLAERGLPTSGNKPDLIERLRG